MSASRMYSWFSCRRAGSLCGNLSGNLIRGTILSLVMAVAGCASAPVQQMSDARQAVRAAQEAGASSVAPQTLTEAETLLARAENLLNKRFFRAARRHAEQAHAKAVSALQSAKGAEHKD